MHLVLLASRTGLLRDWLGSVVLCAVVQRAPSTSEQIQPLSYLFSGALEQAVQSAERAAELSPSDPQNFHWLRCLALAHR